MNRLAFVALAAYSMFAFDTPIFADAPKTRVFEFNYAGAVTGLQPGQSARVWLPFPSSTDEQKVTVVRKELPGDSNPKAAQDYGNQMIYFEAKANAQGQIPFSITYSVERKEVRADAVAKNEDTDGAERFLKADALVPVGGKCLQLLKGKELPSDQLAAGKVLYDVVNDHMRYSKDGTGWGRGDTDWACDSRFGNCTDFHSLFISLARAQKMPAKFEIGFSIPEKRGEGEITGYHCWAKFQPRGKGWVAVDISEADKNPQMSDYYFGNLTADRVTFSVGRDLELTPKQDGPRLNFFVYPYVEVDGKPYPAEKVQRRFSYRDLDPTGK